jgi:hypothetical protein
MKTTLIPIAFVAISTMSATSVYAQCGSSAASRQALLSNFMPAEMQARADTRMASLGPENRGHAAIVGLWDVTFTSAGQVYDEGFDQYHSDGLEIMNDITPPSGGNVCLGVWVNTGPKDYTLKHPFWIFDSNGNLIGRGNLEEKLTLDAGDNSYAGTFTFQFRDLKGNPIPSMPDVSGTLSAQRITVD